MKSPRIPAETELVPEALTSAVARLKQAMQQAAERAVESLGLSALSVTQVQQRDRLLAAQFELNRNLAAFLTEFGLGFDQQLQRELAMLHATRTRHSTLSRDLAQPAAASQTGATHSSSTWDKLQLVEDSELEVQISADRFGMDIAHSCEWELREIDAYLGGLLGSDESDAPRNPLRPEVIGHALIRATWVVSERADTRKVLAAELGRSLAGLLRNAYAGIVSDWRQAGLRPAGLTVRNRGPRDSEAGRRGTVPTLDENVDDNTVHSPDGPGNAVRLSHASGASVGANAGANASANASPGASAHAGRFVDSARLSAAGTELGQIEPALMSVIRRLAFNSDTSHWGAATAYGAAQGGGLSDPGSAPAGGVSLPQMAPLPNLIQAHREELRQASRGALDHLVIDVIGFLFDQILADPKVSPQMARLLARLQLPVLRAALGDPSFFSSRRHPVRRFVNRLASLSAAFDDHSEPAAQAFLAKVASLVGDVVEGDFERADLYEQQLSELERFVAEQSAAELRSASHDAAELLAQKEDEQRLHQLYADRLAGELKDLAAPAFLRDFVSRVWSRVLLQAAQRDGGQGELSARLREAGRELFLSVMPKGTPAQRKNFLAGLPQLMQTLTDGMNLVAWPQSQRQAFFAELMPAHAEALKSSGGRTLDANLLARLVDSSLARPLPSREDAQRASHIEVLSDAIEAVSFSPEQAQQVGLLQESAVDWDGKVDIDLDQVNADAGAEDVAPAAVLLPGLPALPTTSETPSPQQLADQVQVGFAYQMHLEGGWQKVRLTHVSNGRNFFVFSRSGKHRQNLSLTHRMLVRMSESGRLRTIEKDSLLERATARARRQLSALAGGLSAPRAASA